VRRYAIVIAGLALALLTGGCGGNGGEVESSAPANITVTSSAFAEGESIPQEYSCRGRNVSPPLSWSGIPASAQALALVVDDPDAPRGTFTHWVAVDFAPTVTSLGQGEIPSGAVQANNSAGNPGYTGPCPPSGTHHYRFTVYALSERTGLTDGADLAEAQRTIAEHAIVQGTLTGTFAA